jgi:nitrate/TMAO reductase-like tetraheme cytochrome c subunit
LKTILQKIRSFFFPPPESSTWIRLLPYITLGAISLLALTAGAYAWDYTNSPEFCGTACHTMPPEYTAYLTSPHARIDCVECHIGRDFIATRITRKAGDVRHIIAQAFTTYEYPIRAHTLRPARETCERCHYPQKFSDDSLRVLTRFTSDIDNTPTSIYLTLKTGGGSKRLGLGRGIHWHIENQVLYLPLGPEEQEIPYVRVVNDDGSIEEYFDLDYEILADEIDPIYLKEMDCITCHNRITHLIYQPEDSIDQLISQGLISSNIPEIRLKALEIFETDYETIETALDGIAGLEGYYLQKYPQFANNNVELIADAINELQNIYQNSVFPEQKVDWDSHPDNAGHKDSPGCFRCHDGKHLTTQKEAIRLECNLCHSIPVVAGPSDFITEIEISRGPEPESHLNPNWITLHRDVFDPTCSNCHTTDNPGGVDNTSFCSNSACHGTVWEFAGFDAPKLREILLEQLPPPPEPEPTAETQITFEGTVGPLLELRCVSCHGEGGLQGLNLTTYETLLAGGESGPGVIPGDAEGSLVVQKQQEEQAHFSQFSTEELELVIQWIEAGAPEN